MFKEYKNKETGKIVKIEEIKRMTYPQMDGNHHYETRYILENGRECGWMEFVIKYKKLNNDK